MTSPCFGWFERRPTTLSSPKHVGREALQARFGPHSTKIRAPASAERGRPASRTRTGEATWRLRHPVEHLLDHVAVGRRTGRSGGSGQPVGSCGWTQAEGLEHCADGNAARGHPGGERVADRGGDRRGRPSAWTAPAALFDSRSAADDDLVVRARRSRARHIRRSPRTHCSTSPSRGARAASLISPGCPFAEAGPPGLDAPTTASSASWKDRPPAATSAPYSPTEWPITMSGAMPYSAQQAVSAMSTVITAGCVISVGRSSASPSPRPPRRGIGEDDVRELAALETGA